MSWMIGYLLSKRLITRPKQIKVIPESPSVDAIIVRDYLDTEDRIKVTEDGKVYFDKLGTGIYYKDLDGVYRNALTFGTSYGGLVSVGNIYRVLQLLSGGEISLDVRGGVIIQSSFAGNPLKFRTAPAVTKAIAFQSHDGIDYRTNIKFIGGQTEIYSWDGTVEQLVAKTSSGYLELHRALLPNDVALLARETDGTIGSILKLGSDDHLYISSITTGSKGVYVDGYFIRLRSWYGQLWLQSGYGWSAHFNARMKFSHSATAVTAINSRSVSHVDIGDDIRLYAILADSTTTLRSSPIVGFCASVWDSAASTAKDQWFKIYHEPTGLDSGYLRIKFVKTDGTEYSHLLSIGISSSDILLRFDEPSTTAIICTSRVIGDSYPRLVIRADGKIEWGPGSAARDTFLERIGPGKLQVTSELYDDAGVLINEKLIRYDDTQVSFTNTTSTAIKTFRFYKRKWRNMRLLVSAWGDGTNIVYVEIYIDGTLMDSFSTTASSETVFERVIDISGLTDNALHTVDINMYVSGGTGYTQFLEAWVW